VEGSWSVCLCLPGASRGGSGGWFLDFSRLSCKCSDLPWSASAHERLEPSSLSLPVRKKGELMAHRPVPPTQSALQSEVSLGLCSPQRIATAKAGVCTPASQWDWAMTLSSGGRGPRRQSFARDFASTTRCCLGPQSRGGHRWLGKTRGS
jgi:hypothetical protein